MVSKRRWLRTLLQGHLFCFWLFNGIPIHSGVPIICKKKKMLLRVSYPFQIRRFVKGVLSVLKDV